jgi:hypothetical protein
MGGDKHMTICSELKENDYKTFASQMYVTFFSTTRKLSHDISRHSRGIVRIHT